MSYAAALDHLYALGQELVPPAPTPDMLAVPRRKFDLAHMHSLCRALGDPQMQFPSVLIAGTNGKGSTAATLASIFTAGGYQTGLYTSPHLVRVNERIQIDHVEIADDVFARLYFQVDCVAGELVKRGELPYPPSFFEVLTAVAFLYFKESQVDIAILEVGLGGRLDATNVVEPLLSILTDIALDHQDYLGETIAEIAGEKAGILRPNGTLITLSQHPEANQVIGEAAERLHVHGVNAAAFLPPQRESRELTGQEVLPANRYVLSNASGPIEVDSPLPGHHQQRNLAIALAAAEELRNPDSYTNQRCQKTGNHSSYKLDNAALAAGIRDTRWPGRLELLPAADAGAPAILLDVAHNPAGAWTLRDAISRLPESQPRTLLFSCLRDKSLIEMSRILFPLFDSSADGDPLRSRDHIVLAPIANPRASSVEDLMYAANALGVPAHAAPHVAAALAQARQITPAHGLIIATGSVYLVGEIRQLVVGKPQA